MNVNPAQASGTGPPEAFDTMVLGAGISGLVSASILLERGSNRVLLLDEYDKVGGNHIDVTLGNFTFDVGSFLFQDDSPLLGHFPELLPHYVPIDPTTGKLTPQGVITQYPFSLRDDFLSASPVECSRILLSAGLARLRRRTLRTAADFAEYWVGPRLVHRSGLGNYIARFCGVPADEVDLEFAESRMQWIAENASVTALVRRARAARGAAPPASPANQQLARPREGFADLYRPAVQRLQERGVTLALGTTMTSLRKVGDDFHLTAAGRRFSAPRVVSTVPVDRVRELCGLPSARPLPSVTLISLFFSFAGQRGFADTILYNFSHDGAWKRLTVYSDFYGPAEGREFFAVEVIASQVQHSLQRAVDDFLRHTRANGLFRGDLRLEGSYTLDHAYPIYTQGAGERARESIAQLRALGIESFGRQGGFRYQPTARASTVEAEAALGGAPPVPGGPARRGDGVATT